MDPATLIGVGIAIGSILVAIFLEGGSPAAILVPGPMILVIGGTIGAALAGGLLRDGTAAIASLKKAVLGGAVSPAQTIEEVVRLAERARREGLLALDDAVAGVADPFLRDGLRAAIDGTDPEDLRSMLLDRIDAKRASDRTGARFFQDMGGFAPTIGIIGTVISLVHVLENLGNPSELGTMIAAAFVATLWGVLSANILWIPLANRLKRLSEIEVGQMVIVVEGIVSIQAGANPRLVKERLASLVPSGAGTGEEKAA